MHACLYAIISLKDAQSVRNTNKMYIRTTATYMTSEESKIYLRCHGGGSRYKVCMYICNYISSRRPISTEYKQHVLQQIVIQLRKNLKNASFISDTVGGRGAG